MPKTKHPKFKIYDTQEKSWYHEQVKKDLVSYDLVVNLDGKIVEKNIEGLIEDVFPGRFKLLEWTTHTDKNGVPIYQGDILQYEFEGDDNTPFVCSLETRCLVLYIQALG